jgi:hypothetical protein
MAIWVVGVLQSGDTLFEITSFLSTYLLAILTIISIVLLITVPIVLDRRRHRRELTYRILSYEPLRRGMPGLEVTFNGSAVAEPYLCTFKITNTGRVPIVEREFSRSISVNFSPCSHPNHSHTQPSVLAYDLLEQSPKNLAPRITLLMGRLSIDPMLLNPSETFSVRVLLDHCFDHDKLDIDSRIVGISEVKPPPEPRVGPVQWRLLALLLLGIYAVVIVDFYTASSLTIAVPIIAVLVTAAYAAAIAESSSRKRSR